MLQFLLFNSYETSDGITRSEEAEIKNPGTENEILVVRGTVSWVAPDGIRYTITFVSDENGKKKHFIFSLKNQY
jgi:hypothetical protein